MKYISLADLSQTIRNNIWKIPHDIDFIIGVPRSGMIVASILSDYLNCPLIDINSFLAGLEPSGGGRLEFFKNGHKKSNKVLVIDDTVWRGASIKKVKEKLKSYTDLTFIYGCAYLEGPAPENTVDFYLEDLRQHTNGFSQFCLYEWNILQHHPFFMKKCAYDIDGVFCIDPPDERNEPEYLEYIKHAPALFIPTSKIGAIVTYRLIKNKDITEKWLEENGVKYNKLVMFNANSWEERNNSGISPELYKATFYKQNSYMLFVESSDYQAKRIFEMTGKPVYSIEGNKLYQ